MAPYIITCPICKKQYKLTPKDPSTLAQKTFSCPNCRYTAPFPSLIKNLAKPQPVTRSDSTDIPQIQTHNLTKVSTNGGIQGKAYLTVVGNNARFVLSPGIYILGRKSSDSTATLQLAPDISMSRQHARLAVQVIGGRIMAQIIGMKANNPVIINGKVYAAGQPCTLKPGDKLRFGMTLAIYSI